MELLEFKNKLLELCKCNCIKDVPSVLLDVVMAHDVRFYNHFDSITDNTKDWLQALWQYYEADRKEKKQDYTPINLCKLVSALSGNCKTVYDCCGGSGALTVQMLQDGRAKSVYVEEIDDRVIPFLLFNLCKHNADGYVINGDVLTKATFKCYRLEKGERYSSCEIVESVKNESSDVSISNPPYNIKWSPPSALEQDERFPVVPPASNANYAFVLNCLSKSKNKTIMILPNAVASSDIDIGARRYLIENDFVEAVITMPDKMFEITSISVCILVLNKNKAHNGEICFIDSRKKCVQEKRAQNGQFGGNSHTNRTYEKKYNALTDKQIEDIVSTVSEWKQTKGFSAIVQNAEIAKTNYFLVPSRYIAYEEKEEKHRDFQEIADNFNYVCRMQNSCKLVINETIAEKYGLNKDIFAEAKKQAEETKKFMQQIGVDIEVDDYVQFTKNKNEIIFKCNDKDFIPDILYQFLAVWKNQIALLNTMQNRYLVELKDALLPDLMSGKIEI